MGVKFINQHLVKVLRHRSLESIKGAQRKSNVKYQRILEELRRGLQPVREEHLVKELAPQLVNVDRT